MVVVVVFVLGCGLCCCIVYVVFVVGDVFVVVNVGGDCYTFVCVVVDVVDVVIGVVAVDVYR